MSTTKALGALQNLRGPCARKVEAVRAEADQEGWMVSYADMITLLFIFFALMLSISAVSKAKFDLITQQFNQASATSLLDIKKELDQEIARANIGTQVSTAINEDGLLIQFNESVLFPSGRAELMASGAEVMGRFAGMLAKVQKTFMLAVEGHTDDRPINTKEFNSNWALSSSRSVNVLHFLSARGMDQKRMVVRAFADTRPAVKGDTEEARGKNRRVTLLVY